MIMGDKRYPGLFTLCPWPQGESFESKAMGLVLGYARNFKSQISDLKFAI
jgi:hypothetical protein